MVFINEEASPGLKRGGVLNVVRHELELVCDATKIPDEIEVDVTGNDIGDSIHISGDAAQGQRIGDHRSRFHHRDDRCSLGAEVERRRSRRRG